MRRKTQGVAAWPRRLALVVALGALGAVALQPLPGSTSRAQGGHGAIEGKITLMRGGEARGDHSEAAVYLEDVPDSEPEDEGGHHVIRQENRTFIPKVSIVPVGTTVEFPNDDMIYHNVFSLSRPARFDLGLYRAGATRSATMARPGVVDIYCNIHSEMHAKVKVVDTKHFDQPDKNGRFRIEDVPAGKYPLVAWNPWGDDEEAEITVEPGRTTRLSIRLTQGERTEPHKRKDGTPYGRYR